MRSESIRGMSVKNGCHAARIAERFVGEAADVRGFDNSAIKICHIVRNAAHLRVECRCGSEGANLLVVMTILRAAGGVTRRIDGEAMETHLIALEEQIDFVCSSNLKLVNHAIRLKSATQTGLSNPRDK